MFNNELKNVGLKYFSENRIIFDSSSLSAENAAIIAGESNSVVSMFPAFFEPNVPEFSDVAALVTDLNDPLRDIKPTFDDNFNIMLYPGTSSASAINIPEKYGNNYGFISGVISYATKSLWAPDDGTIPVHDMKFWYMVNSYLKHNMSMGVDGIIVGENEAEGGENEVEGGIVNSQCFQINEFNGELPEGVSLSEDSLAKMGFYSHSVMLAPNEPVVIPHYDDSENKITYTQFSPHWTGNRGCLPVGLVMNRDIVRTRIENGSQVTESYNNFSVYGFVTVFPFYSESQQIIYGLSLGKDLFKIGQGLRVEVFLASIVSDNLFGNDIVFNGKKYCYLSGRNLVTKVDVNNAETSSNNAEASSTNVEASSGGPSSSLASADSLIYGQLENLFSGGSGGKDTSYTLIFSCDNNAEHNIALKCKVIYHSIIDTNNWNGVFMFDNAIKVKDDGEMSNVRHVVLGMRPYDINGINGKRVPPDSNPYATDETFCGNYMLVDISDKKFYWVV